MTAYWTLKDDVTAYEFETYEEISNYLNEKFGDDICENECPVNGEEFNDETKVVLLCHETDRILEEKTVYLEYTHYHGDYEEHNTYWSVL